MAYEKQRTVKDGDEIIREDDLTNRDPTKGPLLYALDEDGKARPVIIAIQEIQTVDQDVKDTLSAILSELKKINTMIEIGIN